MASGHWYSHILSSSPQSLLTKVENVFKAENLLLNSDTEKSLLGPLRLSAAAGFFPSHLPFPISITIAQAKKLAKNLHKALCASGNKINLTTSQHVFAKFYGYSSWQHFIAAAQKTNFDKKAVDSSQASPKEDA